MRYVRKDLTHRLLSFLFEVSDHGFNEIQLLLA